MVDTVSGHYPPKPIGGMFDGTDRLTEEQHGLPEGWRNARLNDPDTSKAAAIGDRKFLRRKILASIESFSEHGMGATKWDVADDTGLLAESVHKRISDLRDDGLVHDSGWRRNGPSGRACIVWKSTR